MKLHTVLFALLGLTLSGTISHAATASANDPVLRFAVIGDAEPKPDPVFPGLAGAVDDINRLAEQDHLDLVIGVGDIAHKGTQIQYEAASQELRRLTLPFYPIMGNEEHGSSVERFLHYAQQWNQGKAEIDQPSYVLNLEPVALVFASPDHGRDFNDQGIVWVLEQIRQLAPKPVLLVVHGAPAGVFPEDSDKGIKHPGFTQVTSQSNLLAVISGDLHMDMDRVKHSRQIDHVHYLHIPGLERTKIPDESNHTPMFRVVSVFSDGQLLVETYQVGSAQPLPQHDYRFQLTRH